MKFYFFHLMPWPDLPADFSDKSKHPSAWVTLSNRFYDPEKGHLLYNRYLDELEYAEKLGFDGVCVNEHHQNAYGTMPAPNIVAATLVRRTNRMKIGSSHQRGCYYVWRGHRAIRVLMVLVDTYAVEAELFGIFKFVEVTVVK